MEIDQSSQESVEATPPVAINIKNTEPITKQKKARRQKRKNNRMKLPYFSSKKEQVKSFLDEVRKQFKEGNLPLYEQAVKNLEQHYENVAQNGNIAEEKVDFFYFFAVKNHKVFLNFILPRVSPHMITITWSLK